MAKYLSWDATAKRLKEVVGLVTSAGAGDAGKIPQLDSGGKLDVTLLPSGIGAATFTAVASEALAAGDFVNIYDNAGTINCRKADASNGRRADGHVLAAVASSATATIYYGDVNNQRTGLTVGVDYFLSHSVAGGVVVTPSTTAGHLVQRVGKARSATELVVELGEPVELA